MRAAAAGDGLDPSPLGALFLNRCASAKARLARSSLRLHCAALSSSPSWQRRRMLLKSSLRWVAPVLQHECGHRHTSQRQRSNREALKFFFVFFCLKSSVRSRIRLRSANARLGRPWPELGGMADQAAPGHRGRGAQFRARLGRRARFLIAVHCCARWRHARRRAHSVCKQTLREPQM